LSKTYINLNRTGSDLFLNIVNQAISKYFKHLEPIQTTHSSIYYICVYYHENLTLHKDRVNKKRTLKSTNFISVRDIIAFGPPYYLISIRDIYLLISIRDKS